MTVLPWQHAHWAHLHSYIVQQRIPQADSHACGHCHSCLLLTAQTHPDFMIVQPEEGKTTIAIDQIRSLITNIA
jgi:DNA polymerase III subunit delta'